MKRYLMRINLYLIAILLLNVSCNTGPEEKTITVDGMEISYKEDFSKVKYSNARAIEYAKLFSYQNSNSCGKYFDQPNKTDCSHFIAHCLKAGGIIIKHPESDPNGEFCPEKLAVRAQDLIKGLRKLDQQYENVTEMDFSDIPVVGDYGFLDNITYDHAFMICKPSTTKKDITVWAHYTNRNCEKMDVGWFDNFETAFNMVDN